MTTVRTVVLRLQILSMTSADVESFRFRQVFCTGFHRPTANSIHVLSVDVLPLYPPPFPDVTKFLGFTNSACEGNPARYILPVLPIC